MSTTQELIERLLDVGTIKSDDAYDGVDPRVVRAMRKVSETMAEAAARLSELSAELDAVKDDVDRLHKLATDRFEEIIAMKAENAKLREALDAPICINLNDPVSVRLTDAGLAKLKQDHDAFWAQVDHAARPFAAPKVDENGWSKWQLWTLMSELGPHIGHGVPPVIADLCVRIEPTNARAAHGGAG